MSRPYRPVGCERVYRGGVPELVLPHAVRAALWLPLLASSDPERDRVLDDALRAVSDGESHLVHAPDGDERELRRAAGSIIGQQVTDVGAVLPAPGHVAGVPGVVLTEAVEAGQCVLLRTTGGSWALVPRVESFGSELEPGTLVHWMVHPFPFAERPVPTLLGQVGSLRQARQDITQALLEAGDALESLDLAGWRPDVALEAAHLMREEVSGHQLPPGLEPARVEVLSRAARLLAVVELATADDGGALGAAQGTARLDVLRELAATARRALAAASVSTRLP